MTAIDGVLSTRTHPGFRSHLRQYKRLGDGAVRVAIDRREPAGALRHVRTAATICLGAFKRATGQPDAAGGPTTGG